jgi:hypothetical protein
VAVVIGAVLGLRFRMFALLPVICGGLAIIAVNGVAHGDGFLRLALAMAAIAAALQLGYFIGNVAVFVLNIVSASSHHIVGAPGPTGHPRQHDSRMPSVTQ